jgi:hypothetical protein
VVVVVRALSVVVVRASVVVVLTAADDEWFRDENARATPATSVTTVRTPTAVHRARVTNRCYRRPPRAELA